MLRQIAGLDLPDTGQVIMGERDITFLPPARRDYGIVFQSYALFPNLDVAANIAYGLTGRREDKQRRVSELLALIGLVPATIWWDNAWALCASLVVFAAVYIWLYSRLVSWRRPMWLLLPSLGRDHNRHK